MSDRIENIKKYLYVDFKLAGVITISLMAFFTILNIFIPNQGFVTLNIIALVWLFIQKQGEYTENFVNNVKLFATVLNFGLSTVIMNSIGLGIIMINALLFVVFYAVMAISLNMSTGLTGIVNFGVVAQVAVGAVIVGLFSVRGMPIFFAFMLGIVGTAIFSGLLAITTLRLRDDYFAIISITIGEIIRQILLTEPSLRARPGSELQTTAGILEIPQPFFEYWNNVLAIEGAVFEGIPYGLFLGIFMTLILLVVLFLVNLIFYSPYGRILKSIREDELVVKVYGKQVFRYKVVIMILSGAVAGVGGGMLAWLQLSIFPENFMPLVTFFIWTAFIIGGRGNNKGMVVGSIVFILLQRASRFLNDTSNVLFQGINSMVQFVNPEAPSISSGALQLLVVGLVLILFLRFSPRGILPEEAYRPKFGSIKLPPPGSQADTPTEGTNK